MEAKLFHLDETDAKDAEYALGLDGSPKKTSDQELAGGFNGLQQSRDYTATFLRLGRDNGVSFFILLGTRVLEKNALQRCLFSNGQSMIFQQGV